MTLVFAVVLLIAVLIFVGYPLFDRAVVRTTRSGSPELSQFRQLLGERENAVAGLKDLEFEHSIGNLSDEDYGELRAAHRHKAIAILRELDRASSVSKEQGDAGAGVLDSPALESHLEEEIARARKRLEHGDNQAPDAGAASRPVCPACGSPGGPATRFCSRCAQGVDSASRCHACGATVTPGARHCARCGVSVSRPGNGR